MRWACAAGWIAAGSLGGMLACGVGSDRSSGPLERLGTVSSPLTSGPDVLTQRNDGSRMAQNYSETLLTLSNVNASTFGRRFAIPVDGYVFAQPLYKGNVTVQGSAHNVLFVATQHDSVYAFDADSGTALWHTSFINPPAVTPDTATNDIANEIGITSTPVIDSSTGTLYTVGRTKENGASVFRIHALDITTGSEVVPNALIMPTAGGTGTGSNDGGTVNFDATWQLQRPGLALVNGVVYVAFGANGDGRTWHGWLVGFRASDLSTVTVWNATPNGTGGGIWASGEAPAVDSAGNLIFPTGNGDFDGVTEFGDSVVSLSTGSGLGVVGYFSPYNQSQLDSQDLDVAAAGIALLPDVAGTTAHPHLAVASGKGGSIYLLDRDNLGGYNPSTTSPDSNIVQEIPGAFGAAFGSPTYWRDSQGTQHVYWGPWGYVTMYNLANGQLSTPPASKSTVSYAYPGSNPVISSNGSTNGILWAVDNNSAGAILHAYDARNLTSELYNSAQATNGRDSIGPGVKFVVPTITNGMVYVGYQFGVAVFGALSPGAPPPDAGPVDAGPDTNGQDAASAPIVMGEPNVLGLDDSGNSNLLIAQQASLGQNATIQSLNFYVTQAAGSLLLGVYDSTGPNGGPGSKVAETNEITPAVGWNTAAVVSPISLLAGTYWLTYFTNSDNLHFARSGTGSFRYYPLTYDTMPDSFSETPTSGVDHWSFYATLSPITSPAPTAPTTLAATATGPHEIDLSWINTSTDQTGVKVERSFDGISFALVAVAGATATGYADTGVSPSTAYIYRVRATGSGGDSPPSGTATATTPPAPPPDAGPVDSGPQDTGPADATSQDTGSGDAGTADAGSGADAGSAIIMGESSVLPLDDNGNANLLIAQQASLGQGATIQSLSFYVKQAAGKLRLGVYDATGPGGGPGAKQAETNEITPTAGWNTAAVVSPVSLAAGTYWLTYFTNDNNLHFSRAGTGTFRHYSLTYGPMPTAFSTSNASGIDHWSFYATLSTAALPPPDAGTSDAGSQDAGPADAGSQEAGLDGGSQDAGSGDAGSSSDGGSGADAGSPIIIGESNVLTVDDSGNANLLISQQASLGQNATIKSLSFYVSKVSGKLRLGIYDATGPSGGPGSKLAETSEITPVVGWNTAPVVSSALLPAGTYWLTYFTNSNSLHFRSAGATGAFRYYSLTYGSMPSTFSATPTSGVDHWSFYATLSP